MPDKHHLDNDFKKIDCLYLEYLKALGNKNNENLLIQIREKIVVAFWKTLQKASSITPEMIEHTDVLINKIYYCMNKCAEDGIQSFCKYTYVSIVKALRTEADKDAFEEESGMHLTDNRTRKKIENAYKQYKVFNSDDKYKFMEYAISHLGLRKEDLEEYLFPKRSISLFASSKSNSNEEYCIVDRFVDTSKNNDSIEKFSSKGELSKYLTLINKEWLKQKDETRIVLSELLTRDLLADLEKNNLSEDFRDMFSGIDFISKQMIESFFTDKKYKLPSQQEIGENYGLTKSAASVKLKRFIEKLRNR